MKSHANSTLIAPDMEEKTGMEIPKIIPSDDHVQLPRTVPSSASNLDQKSTPQRVTEPAIDTVGEDDGNLVSF